MKKKILVGTLVMVLGVGSLIGYADSAKTPNILPGSGTSKYTVENNDEWFKKMHEFRKEEITRALERGLITKDEAKVLEENLKYMEEHHQEYGYMSGGCGGLGMGRGIGFGMGRGMMGGHHGMKRGNSSRTNTMMRGNWN